MIKKFSGKPGPKVVIMGSLHGNEPIGALLIKELISTLKFQEIHGEIHLIIGNPKALKANKRFIDTDLNRIFHLNFKKPYNIEEQRALKLAAILSKTDYLLDIHSTQKQSIPFIYCKNSKKHIELAEIFQTKYIVTASKNFKNKKTTVSSDNFVDQNGGIGITYESGWNKDTKTLKKTLQKTKEFLSYIKVAFTDIKPQSEKTTILEVQEYLIPNSKDFKFQKDYINFDIIKSGKTIAKEDKKGIKKPYNSYILFPKKKIEINKPAIYLAKKI